MTPKPRSAESSSFSRLLPLALVVTFFSTPMSHARTSSPADGQEGQHQEHQHGEEHGEEHDHGGSHGHGEGHGDGEGHGHAAGHGRHGEDLHAAGFHHDFGDAERWAKIFDAPERVEWQKPEEVVRLMAIEPGMAVADIGAGTGFFLGYLSTAVGPEGRVLGLDVAEEMVGHMTERAEKAGWSNTAAKVVPTDDPELGAGTIDRILIVNTWHHIDDRPVYGAKLAKALRPGGAVYIVDYTLESEAGPPKAHRLPPERVVRELAAADFDARIVEEALPRQYVIEARPKH